MPSDFARSGILPAKTSKNVFASLAMLVLKNLSFDIASLKTSFILLLLGLVPVSSFFASLILLIPNQLRGLNGLRRRQRLTVRLPSTLASVLVWKSPSLLFSSFAPSLLPCFLRSTICFFISFMNFLAASLRIVDSSEATSLTHWSISPPAPNDFAY